MTIIKEKSILLILIFLSFKFFAQDNESESIKYCNDNIDKKAIKLYEKAINKKKYKKPERIQFLNNCLEIEPDFAEANLFMGLEMIVTCKLENKPFRVTLPYFLKAISVCPQVHSEPYYYIGYDYYERNLGDSATKYLEKFIAFKDEDDKKFAKDYEAEIYQAKMMIKSIKKESSLKRNVPFDPKVVKGVSTERDEYLAYISPDDKNCFYVRRLPINNIDKVYSSDKEREVFMISKRDKTSVFNRGEEMPYPFNVSGDNQGGCSISIDNKNLYFAMQRDEGGNQPNVDIYVSSSQNGEWQPYRKLSNNVNHPVYWDSQPTISADGVTLIFASDRPGGYGGIDLYVTVKDLKTNIWSVPKNLGPKINTRGNEKTPFIHSDSETLYFSSDGHYGFGGLDIFYVRKDEKGEWMEPENIGSPINGTSDDAGFFVSSDTKSGYFFSFDEGKVRGKGVGRYDLYNFELYKEARPQQIAFVKGQIKDEQGKGVSNAIVEIKNVNDEKSSLATVDSTSGEFMMVVNLKKKDDLLITVKKEEYAFSSQVLNVKDLTYESPTKEVKFELSEAVAGKPFVINNIYYKTNSADLAKESMIVLKSFANYLKENPEIKIEIQGHTDNVGNPKDNEALSTNRAYSIKSLIEEFGINGGRIQAKGYGSGKPVASNNTEEGRAKNRRTEFVILEK
jgi:outer membrane protein OmpA-like peptidoglycan-associated protein